jgi:hypothetical protein
MPRKGSALLRSLETLLQELVKKGYIVEFKMDFEDGYVKWKIAKTGK